MENQMLKNDEISLQTDERKASEIMNHEKQPTFEHQTALLYKLMNINNLRLFTRNGALKLAFQNCQRPSLTLSKHSNEPVKA